ncbi:hypothetical protein H8N03_04910 [Ramlibacter sp. USB13]|uniref:Uncharacterized protein n=1 Tax=Ramlibacter cellulosilyticus TaxID=2764187 RepID=A0A923SA09_9BURK|nr:hypothetical protein [Ramlibacter cellulosilyticus]MBC5782274.1 hypothetical protein [Ramlibacter cellulosilyticus]
MQVRTAGVPAVLPQSWRWFRLACALLLFAGLASCAGVKLVADYDAESAKGITDTSAEVFAFYDKVIEAKAKAAPGKLPYAGFADDWGRIETRIRVLVVREESRSLNSESQRIARTILGFWQKYRARHQGTDDYNARLAGIHRDRFQRLFTAALVAEKAKALATDDSNPEEE